MITQPPQKQKPAQLFFFSRAFSEERRALDFSQALSQSCRSSKRKSSREERVCGIDDDVPILFTRSILYEQRELRGFYAFSCVNRKSTTRLLCMYKIRPFLMKG